MKKGKIFIIFISILLLVSVTLLITHNNSFSNPLKPIINKDKEQVKDYYKVDINDEGISVNLNHLGLELPINGATGYTSVKMNLINQNGDVIKELNAGTPFTILDEADKYFEVALEDNTTGFLDNTYCLVNLPDVIPSIVYDDTNSYRSIFRSNGEKLEGVTNEQLYNAESYNERLQRHEFLMPVLYNMAKKIAKVQNKALKNNESLVIYEAFRPYEVQMQVSNALEELMNANEDVYNLINTPPWGKGWFIATTLSNHQRGFAIDTSLVKVNKASIVKTGKYEYLHVDEYSEYDMPTPMHELSSLAATFTTPVNSSSKTAWKSAKYASSMNEDAIRLQKYCTENGLSPLASEWWHFNDLDSKEATDNNKSNGRYYIETCLSKIPN